jgi:hypothetical protein
MGSSVAFAACAEHPAAPRQSPPPARSSAGRQPTRPALPRAPRSSPRCWDARGPEDLASGHPASSWPRMDRRGLAGPAGDLPPHPHTGAEVEHRFSGHRREPNRMAARKRGSGLRPPGRRPRRRFPCRQEARATGLEPATSGVTGRRSNQLSYARWGSARIASTTPAEVGRVGRRRGRFGKRRAGCDADADLPESPVEDRRPVWPAAHPTPDDRGRRGSPPGRPGDVFSHREVARAS